MDIELQGLGGHDRGTDQGNETTFGGDEHLEWEDEWADNTDRVNKKMVFPDVRPVSMVLGWS